VRSSCSPTRRGFTSPSTLSLEWAKESLESRNVAGYQEEAFLETGQVVRVSESDGLFAHFDLTDRV
jgi:hypothetical protein